MNVNTSKINNYINVAYDSLTYNKATATLAIANDVVDILCIRRISVEGSYQQIM